jgi:hypothetical protein
VIPESIKIFGLACAANLRTPHKQTLDFLAGTNSNLSHLSFHNVCTVPHFLRFCNRSGIKIDRRVRRWPRLSLQHHLPCLVFFRLHLSLIIPVNTFPET